MSGKAVLLRYDLDVPLRQVQDKLVVSDDFRLKKGLATLNLALHHAQEVILMGHLGRPGEQEDPNLSVAPIYDWLEENGYREVLESQQLRLLENLRFESGEDECHPGYVKELASYGEVFINEAFAAFHQAASTTELPRHLPHAAGLNFAKEVEMLEHIRENPSRPLVVILGGAKIEDKVGAVSAMSKIADMVLVGGRLPGEIIEQQIRIAHNVFLAEMNVQGLDITPQTTRNWAQIISKAKMVVWNGPLGRVEDHQNSQSLKVAQAIISSGAESIVGGGDTVNYLSQLGYLDQFTFVSTGGGAMLEYLRDGTLPTIKALGG